MFRLSEAQNNNKRLKPLKNRISEKSCLEFPEPDLYYELDKDVLLNGIRAVLFQKDPFCQVVYNRICKQSLI